MRYVGALMLALLPSAGWAWTCAYLWEDSTPVYGIFPGKNAMQDTRLKVCYDKDDYNVVVEQRYYHTVRDGEKDVDQEIAGWHGIARETLPRHASPNPPWLKTWQEADRAGWPGGGY